MKKTILFLFILIGLAFSGKAQDSNDVLNLLISNKVITQQQADSVRTIAASKKEADQKKIGLFSSHALQLSGYMQFRYQNFEAAGKNSSFDIRRARLDMRALVTSDLTLRFQTDFAGSAKILDAYAEYKPALFFVLTMGQFKVPFSLENLTSSNKLDFIDRSQAVEALTARSQDVIGNQNGRDIGIQVGGTFLNIANLNRLEYKIGVFNGSGINSSDLNGAKDIAGRLVAQPLKNLFVGGNYYYGWDVPLGATKSQERSRYGFDFSYDFDRFTVRGEYLHGTDKAINRAGWYAQAGAWIVPQKFQFLLKYDTYDPNRSVADNATTNYIVGVNYFFNSWSKLQASYTFREEQGTSVRNNLGVIQYQISF